MVDRAITLVALAAAVVFGAAAASIPSVWKKVSYAVAGLIFLGAGVAYFMPEKPDAPKFSGITTNGPGSPGVMTGGTLNVNPPPITDAQALIDIDNWIGQLQEYELQEEFDYVGTFRKNIDIIIKNHGPWNGQSPIKEHFILAHGTRCKVKQDKATNIIADFAPGHICLLFVTDKWIAARGKLQRYAIRASLPSDVKEALAEIETTVDANMNAMGNLLEASYQSDRDMILKANSKDTIYLNRLLNTYRGQLLPLEPHAKKINALIAQHLQK